MSVVAEVYSLCRNYCPNKKNIDNNILKCVYPTGEKVKSSKGSAHMTEHKSGGRGEGERE